MGYVNVGAYYKGQRVKTKKALKEAMQENPGAVWFDRTSIFDQGDKIRGTEIPRGAQLSVVGPDPYTDRRFYATVELVGTKVRVS